MFGAFGCEPRYLHQIQYMSRECHPIGCWMVKIHFQSSLERGRARKFSFCDENYTTAELLDKADARLFSLVKDQNIVFIIFYLTLLTANL